jgi:hypothetical protein
VMLSMGYNPGLAEAATEPGSIAQPPMPDPATR